MAKKLWEKNIDVNPEIERFTVGRDRELDLMLARYDVLGSLAHCRMLESIGMLTGEELEKQGIHARVINMATIKPLDEALVLAAAKDCGKIITCEEHSIVGGLGEAVASLVAEKCPVQVRRIGVNDEFGHSGPAVDLLKQFGLSCENIVAVAKELCGK